MDETWTKLKHNMIEIQNHRAGSLSYEENYRYAYNMVLYKHGEPLYKGACQLIADNLEKLAQQAIVPSFPSGAGTDPVQRSQESEVLLKAVRQVWEDHTSSLSRLRDVLKYMVRTFTESSPAHYAEPDSYRIGYTRTQRMFPKYGTPVCCSSSSTSSDHRYNSTSLTQCCFKSKPRETDM